MYESLIRPEVFHDLSHCLSPRIFIGNPSTGARWPKPLHRCGQFDSQASLKLSLFIRSCHDIEIVRDGRSIVLTTTLFSIAYM